MSNHYHKEEARDTEEMEVGNEIWMVVRYFCSECDAFIRYVVVSRRKKDA